MKHIKKLFVISILIIFSFSIIGCNKEDGDITQKPTDNSKIVAQYKGGEVTENELNTYIQILKLLKPELKDQTEDKQFKDQVLNQYVGERYAADQIDKAKEDEVDKLYESYKSQITSNLGSEQKFNDELASLNLTTEDFKAFIQRQIAVQSFFEQRLQDKYNQDKEEFTVVTVSHILIKNEGRTEEEAKARAEEVLNKLKNGADFGQMAKEYSDDPGSKEKGGTYENYPAANFVPEFKDAVLTLKINELSGLVKTDFGYHIIKVLERSIPKFEEVSENVKTTMMTLDYRNFVIKELPELITKKDI